MTYQWICRFQPKNKKQTWVVEVSGDSKTWWVSTVLHELFRKRIIGMAVSGSVGRFESLSCLKMLCWESFNSLLPAKYMHTNLGSGNHIDRGPPAVRQIYGNAGFSKHPFSWLVLFLSGGTKPIRTKQMNITHQCLSSDFWTSTGPVPMQHLCRAPLCASFWLRCLKAHQAFVQRSVKVSCAEVGLEVITLC